MKVWASSSWGTKMVWVRLLNFYLLDDLFSDYI